MVSKYDPNEPPPDPVDSPWLVLLRVSMDTSRRLSEMPYTHVMRQCLRTLCLPGEAHRQSVWEMYEFYEERAMVYTQVVSTDNREMACDNRNLTIPRGELS